MPKNKYVSLLGVLLILASAGSKIAAAAGKSACEVLTKADVAVLFVGDPKLNQAKGSTACIWTEGGSDRSLTINPMSMYPAATLKLIFDGARTGDEAKKATVQDEPTMGVPAYSMTFLHTNPPEVSISALKGGTMLMVRLAGKAFNAGEMLAKLRPLVKKILTEL